MTPTPAIDITLPLEMVDGTPVTYIRPSLRTGAKWAVRIGVNRNGHLVGEMRHYRADGVHIDGVKPNIRNVAANLADRWKGKKLQTRSGTPAEFITVLPDSKVLFKLSYPSQWGTAATTGYVERLADGTVSGAGATRLGTTRSDPDDIIVAPERVTTFRNVYADGTIGDTVHKSVNGVLSAIKSGKVRVGILKQVHEGAELVDASMIARTAERRDGSKAFPKA